MRNSTCKLNQSGEKEINLSNVVILRDSKKKLMIHIQWMPSGRDMETLALTAQQLNFLNIL